ncbi:MAG: hypothetical protein QM677_01370 [Microbacterium sp.]
MRPADEETTRRATRTFVSLTGPVGNIGDALLRRGTLRWALGTSDQVVVYTGDTPDVWLRQLGVPGDALVLRTKRSVPRWLWMLLTAPPRPVLVFEAGEIPLDRGNGLRELVFLLETLIVRLKRGIVVRPPRGIRSPTSPALWLHARAAGLSQVALWRDAESAALSPGMLAPDLGFAAGFRPGRTWSDRDELIVSLRGARPFPSAHWCAAVRTVAATAGLRIRTVVQVREDEQRSRELATALGGEFEPWGQRDALAQEELLRERYENARLVLSDRMHVLVLAALSGATPIELVPRPTGKIAAAFAVIGVAGLSLDADAGTVDEMTEFLRNRLDHHADVQHSVAAAAARLADIESDLRRRIRAVRR